MNKTEKLYLVELASYKLKDGYVVAVDPSAAYEKVRKVLDAKNIGFSGDRELKCVTLLAENVGYPDCETRLYL